MVRARLAVRLPTSAWIHEVSTAHPETTVRVTSLLGGADRTAGVAELHAGDPASVITSMATQDDLAGLELLWSREDVALVQFETASSDLLVLAREAGVPVETPFDVADGTVRWEFSTTRDRLADLGDRLAAAGLVYDVEFVREDGAGSPAVMTDRQREVFDLAVEAGYYETPRTATLTDVAAELDVAKATASDLLHRAEGAVVDWFVEGTV